MKSILELREKAKGIKNRDLRMNMLLVATEVQLAADHFSATLSQEALMRLNGAWALAHRSFNTKDPDNTGGGRIARSRYIVRRQDCRKKGSLE